MTYYGQDYMLEDKAGQLTGSDYEDIHDRIRLTLKCTQRAQTHTVYMIFDRTGTHVFDYNNPLAVLEFGPNDTLGTVSFRTGVRMPMKQYLVKAATFGRYVVETAGITVNLTSWGLKVDHAQVHSARWARISVELAHQTQPGVDGQFIRDHLKLVTHHFYCRQCTNASGYLVACYSLKVEGEPVYPESSGCMLSVDESYPHLLAGELYAITQ